MGFGISNPVDRPRDVTGLSNSDLEQGAITPSKPALMKKFVTEKMGVSSEDYDSAMSSSPPSPEEVDQELLAQGIDPTTATDDQRASATLRVKLGKELGLTPAEIEQVMAAQAMSPVQLQRLMATAEIGRVDGNSALAQTRGTDSIQGSKTRTDAAQMTIQLGPPTPKMSLTSFISALVQAIENVLRAKAQTQTVDAKVMESKLKDTVIMTEEKITQANRANAETVANLRRSLDNMKTMRIVMYTVLALVVLIMIILTVVVTIATGGAGTAPMIIATIAMVMAVAGAATTIALNEEKRKGNLKLSATEAHALVWAMAAAELVAGIASFGIAAVASVIKAMVVQLVAQIIAAVARMVSLVAMSGALEAWAKREAEQKAQHSTERDKIDNNASTRTEEVTRRLESGEITQSQATQLNSQIREEQTGAITNLENTTYKDELKSMQKTMEIVNWVVVAVSIVFAIGSVTAALGGMGNAVKEAVNAAAKMIMEGIKESHRALILIMQKVAEIITLILNIFQTSFQAVMTVKMETQRQSHLEKALDIKQTLIRIETTKAMIDDIKANLDASAQHSAESLKKVIAALSTAFDTNARIMANFTS